MLDVGDRRTVAVGDNKVASRDRVSHPFGQFGEPVGAVADQLGCHRRSPMVSRLSLHESLPAGVELAVVEVGCAPAPGGSYLGQVLRVLGLACLRQYGVQAERDICVVDEWNVRSRRCKQGLWWLGQDPAGETAVSVMAVSVGVDDAHALKVDGGRAYGFRLNRPLCRISGSDCRLGRPRVVGRPGSYR